VENFEFDGEVFSHTTYTTHNSK